MSEFKIVHAQTADIPPIVMLVEDLLLAIGEGEAVDGSLVERNCRQLLADPATILLIASTGTTPAGFISLSIRQTLLHAGPSGCIDELAVVEQYRGQGLGKRLVEAAAEECRRLGCCELEVSTHKANSQARAFYKRCGFEEESVLLEKQL